MMNNVTHALYYSSSESPGGARLSRSTVGVGTQTEGWTYASSVVVARTGPYGCDMFQEDAAGITYSLDKMVKSMADPSRAARE